MLRNLAGNYKILPKQAPVIFQSRNYQDVVKSLSPLAYWPLDETSGTTVYDRSGNGYNGTYSGPTLAQINAPGGGLAPYFDGVNDYATLESAGLQAALNRSEGTLAIWGRVLNAAVWTDAAYRELLHIKVNSTNRVYIIKENTNNLMTFLYNGNSATNKLVQYTMNPTDWVHYALTYSVSGDAMKAYVNGAQVGATQTGITAWAGTPQVDVGYDGVVNMSWWKGWLAHAAIWTRALAPGEIQSLYRGGV